MTENAFNDYFYDAADGLRLHIRVYGAAHESVLPIVCLPGLTRNARDFHKLAISLSQEAPVRRRVLAFDYRGRGQSAYDPNWRNYTVGTELADILHGLANLAIHRAFFIGTSRGGLIALVMAGIKPDLIAATVLNDIGPVIEKRGLDHIRGYLGTPRQPVSRAEAIALQKKAHGPAFPALGEDDWATMADAVYRIEDGQALPDYDPDLVKTITSADPERPLPQLWKEFDALARKPVMAIRGENSMLLSNATLREMQAKSPMVETLTVAGQGHAPFLETGSLPQRIASFFDQAERAGG